VVSLLLDVVFEVRYQRSTDRIFAPTACLPARRFHQRHAGPDDLVLLHEVGGNETRQIGARQHALSRSAEQGRQNRYPRSKSLASGSCHGAFQTTIAPAITIVLKMPNETRKLNSSEGAVEAAYLASKSYHLLPRIWCNNFPGRTI
jgi:hypothetical protein